jgi:hypothetical protein
MLEDTKDYVISCLENAGVSRTKGTKIVINDVACSVASLKDTFEGISGFWTEKKELLEINYKYGKGAYKQIWIEVGSYFQNKEESYKSEQRKQKAINAMGCYQDSLVEDSDVYLEELNSLIPVIIPDMRESSKRVVLFNPAKGRVDLNTDPDIFFMLKNISMKEAIDYGMVRIARLIFNPHRAESSYISENNHLVLNTYNIPPWRKSDGSDLEDKIPDFIYGLLNHLFPEKSVREYVISWICRAVLDRNQTILCLIGQRGTGKGILTEIISCLIGREYSEIGKQSLLDDKFNALMKDNRFVCLDEVVAKEHEQLNVLKAFSNNFIAVEKKGSDQQTIKNYNSMMITVNEENSILFSPQDRRFSVPEITSLDLKRTFSEKVITSYVDRLENDDEFSDIVQFGNWILKHGKEYMTKHPNNIPWKKEHFYRVAKANLSEWKLYLEEYIVDGRDEFIHLSDITKEFKKQYREGLKFPQATATLSTFLRDYLFEGRYRLGDIDKEEGSRGIRVTPDLLALLNKRNPIENRRNDDHDDVLLSPQLEEDLL